MTTKTAASLDPSAANDSVAGKSRPSGRERLLKAANDLFYAEGIQSVGIDRIIERAGVAKATLYNNFASKEELVYAYLRSRHELVEARVGRAMDAAKTPEDKILAIFDSQAAAQRQPEYNGCPFAAARTEEPEGGLVDRATLEYRAWLRGLFVRLAGDAGVADPDLVGRQLHLLYDGTALMGRIEHDPAASEAARKAAAMLVAAGR